MVSDVGVDIVVAKHVHHGLCAVYASPSEPNYSQGTLKMICRTL